jgi:hypothetical protein
LTVVEETEVSGTNTIDVNMDAFVDSDTFLAARFPVVFEEET